MQTLVQEGSRSPIEIRKGSKVRDLLECVVVEELWEYVIL